MGFFSSATSLLGGGSSGSSSGSQSSSIVNDPLYSRNYKNLQREITNMFTNGTGNGANLFTPSQLTQYGTQAAGLTQLPTTQAGVQGLTNNFLNPFTSYLTDALNKQYNAQGSAYKSALDSDGQLASNREFLNTSQNDLDRNSAIGQTLANNYFTAQGNALNSNQNTIANLLGLDTTQRTINDQTTQAPLAALNAFAQLLGSPSANTLGTTSTSTQGASNSGSGTQALSNGASIAASLASFFSDPRLKHNVVYRGTENGYNVYEFSYHGSDDRYIGVMADEIADAMPEAVTDIAGYMAVNYGLIGVEFRRAA